MDTPVVKPAPVLCPHCNLQTLHPCATDDAKQACRIWQAQQRVAEAALLKGPMTDTPATSTTPAAEPAPIPAKTDGLLGAVRDDAGKPQWDLLPGEAVEEILKVLAWGGKKYGKWNWVGGFAWSRVFSATLRHLWAHQRGEDKDPDTGLSHLAHAGANVLFLLSYVLWKRGVDDRPSSVGAGA